MSQRNKDSAIGRPQPLGPIAAAMAFTKVTTVEPYFRFTVDNSTFHFKAPQISDTEAFYICGGSHHTFGWRLAPI